MRHKIGNLNAHAQGNLLRSDVRSMLKETTVTIVMDVNNNPINIYAGGGVRNVGAKSFFPKGECEIVYLNIGNMKLCTRSGEFKGSAGSI